MKPTHGPSLALAAAIAVAAAASLPARAETYARNFELQTLDHHYAASLVVDLCASRGQRPDSCKVQLMNRGMISVYASPAIHAEIVRLLAREDAPVTALGFRVILLRPGDGARPAPPKSPEIRRALEAVEELLGLSSTEVEDTALISTTDRGVTRLAAADGSSYGVVLQLRSVVTRADGKEVTLELELSDAAVERDGPPLLSSVVTLRIGETIVAGTSRAAPRDRPLLVLLSALPLDSKE